MKAFLFILAVGIGLAALAARRHLSHTLEPDDDDRTDVTTTIRTSPQASQNLNYALNRISQGRTAPVAPVTNMPMATPASTDAQISAQVEKILAQMQSDPDQAFNTLEQGLSITTDPKYAALRLRLLQAALSIPGNEGTIKDLSMRALTAYIVEPQGDTPITDPDQVQNLETRRTVVSTTYKLYLNASKDMESAYTDTERVLSYQRDQSTRELIIFDCLSHFPELRSRFIN